MVKQPSALLVSRDESHVFVSSFLNDAVLRAPLSLTMGSRFGIFAQGSYCTRDLSSCAVLNENIRILEPIALSIMTSASSGNTSTSGTQPCGMSSA